MCKPSGSTGDGSSCQNQCSARGYREGECRDNWKCSRACLERVSSCSTTQCTYNCGDFRFVEGECRGNWKCSRGCMQQVASCSSSTWPGARSHWQGTLPAMMSAQHGFCTSATLAELPCTFHPRHVTGAANAGDEHGVRDQFLEWARSNRAHVERELLKYGAILFRGFPFRDADDFDAVLTALGKRETSTPYVAGATPRTRIKGNIYTSTEASRMIRVPQHGEMSYAATYPSHISFFCETPSRFGGETPVADTRRVHAALRETTRQKFEQLGIGYVRRLADARHYPSWVLKSAPLLRMLTWQGAFETEAREAAEAIVRDRYSEHRWLSDGALWLFNRLPAVRRHPITEEAVWFNQAHMSYLHPRWTGPTLTPLLRFVRDRNWLGIGLQDATFGDGSPMSLAEVDDVHAAFDSNQVAFRWRAGDIMILDNLLMSHGRNRFAGSRRILVSMASTSS